MKTVSKAWVVCWMYRGEAVPCEGYTANEAGEATCGEDITPQAMAEAFARGDRVKTYEGFADEVVAQKRAKACGNRYEVRPLREGSFFYIDETLVRVQAEEPAKAPVEKTATELVEEFERALIEAQHKLATVANQHYVARLKRDLIKRMESK
jgi:hypothetical protein